MCINDDFTSLIYEKINVGFFKRVGCSAVEQPLT